MNVHLEELAVIVRDARRWPDIPQSPETHARTIDAAEALLAEVKRLTPREITSVEELDALPVGSVVRDDYGSIFIRKSGSEIGWFDALSGLDPSNDLFGSRYITCPALVIYVPEVQS